LSLQVFVTATWRRDEQNNDLSVDIEAKLCNPSTLQCVGKTPILFQHSFSLDPGTARLDCGSLPDGLTIDARIDDMKLSDFDINLRENDIDTRCLIKLSVGLRVAMVEQFAALVSAGLNPAEGEFPGETFDICIPGVIQFPTMSVTFFTFSQLFFAGPVPLMFSMGAGGSLGASLELKFCLLSMKAIAILTPWLGIDVYGSLEIYLGVFFAGIRLDGRLMQTKFPCTATVAFTKFPLDVGLKMDMEMIPLAFKLSAFCQVGIKIFGKKITKTIFKAVLWEWSMAPIVKNIFTLHTPEKDDSPPAFEAVATDPKSSAVGAPAAKCEVSQIAKRDYTDPAFKLEIFVTDDKSNITTTYSIGRSVNGDDVESNKEMGGMSIIEATKSLPDGVPLYFTVTVREVSLGLPARILREYVASYLRASASSLWFRRAASQSPNVCMHACVPTQYPRRQTRMAGARAWPASWTTTISPCPAGVSLPIMTLAATRRPSLAPWWPLTRQRFSLTMSLRYVHPLPFPETRTRTHVMACIPDCVLVCPQTRPIQARV